MFIRKLFLTAIYLLLSSSALAASAAPRYTLTFLPTGFEPGPYHPLNNTGRIAGTYQGRVAIFDRGGLHPVKSPPAVGNGINDRSDITGRVTGSNTAFAIIGGRFVDIHATLSSFYYTSDGEVINNRGSVAGVADPFADEAVRGFLYRQGRSELVPTLGGEFSFITGLNNLDGVVGWASNATGSVNDPNYHAILYRDGRLHDLGTLPGGLRSQAFDINDRWQIVGASETGTLKIGNPEHPFLFQNGKMTDLGTLGASSGRALAINNGGLVVGDTGRTDQLRVAFLYVSGKMLDLNDLTQVPAGWRLDTAQDINDIGQIVATACYGIGGACVPVRLDPVCPCNAGEAPPTPAPMPRHRAFHTKQ